MSLLQCQLTTQLQPEVQIISHASYVKITCCLIHCICPQKCRFSQLFWPAENILRTERWMLCPTAINRINKWVSGREKPLPSFKTFQSDSASDVMGCSSPQMGGRSGGRCQWLPSLLCLFSHKSRQIPRARSSFNRDFRVKSVLKNHKNTNTGKGGTETQPTG